MIEIETRCIECGRKWNLPSMAETLGEALRLMKEKPLRCKRCSTKLPAGQAVTARDVVKLREQIMHRYANGLKFPADRPKRIETRRSQP